MKPYKFLSLSSKGINEIGTIVVEQTLYFSRSESEFSQLISSAHFSVGWFSENIPIVDNLVILNTYLHASVQEQCGESIYWLLLRVKGLMKQGKSTGIRGIIILMLPKSTKKFRAFTEEVQMAKESLFLIPFDESAELKYKMEKSVKIMINDCS